MRFVQCSPRDAVSVADGQVEGLLDDDGWPPASIGLLTTRHRHPVQKEVVENQGWDAYFGRTSSPAGPCSTTAVRARTPTRVQAHRRVVTPAPR